MYSTYQLVQRIGSRQLRPTHAALEPNVPIPGVWIEPVPQSHVLEPLLGYCDISNVSPARIPGYWLHAPEADFPAAAPPAPGEKVLYALHGGGYTRLSAAPGADGTTEIVRGFLAHGAKAGIRRTFSAEYRLSTGPPYEARNPFPAALLDALAGYVYLVRVVGFKPADIIVEGDSAGGNLALALTRYLVEKHQETGPLPPPPGALVLLSPWSDLDAHSAHYARGSSMDTNYRSDFLTPRGIEYSATAFVGPHDPTIPYISPAALTPSERAGFALFPRTFVVAGGAETLVDQIRTLVQRMRGDMGERIEYWEAADGVHDFVGMTWHEPERTQALTRVVNWIAGV